MAVSQADLWPAQLPLCPSSARNRGFGPSIRKYNGTFQEQSCASRSHIRSIGLCLLGWARSRFRQASVGVAADKSGPLAVSHRQRSQRHLDYALYFTSACAARCLNCHSVEDRRDVASKISRVDIGR